MVFAPTGKDTNVQQLKKKSRKTERPMNRKPIQGEYQIRCERNDDSLFFKMKIRKNIFSFLSRSLGVDCLDPIIRIFFWPCWMAKVWRRASRRSNNLCLWSFCYLLFKMLDDISDLALFLLRSHVFGFSRFLVTMYFIVAYKTDVRYKIIWEIY